MSAATQPFTGFRPEAIQFLADLAANNERTWFQPRKADYERLLKEPLEALCAALAARFEADGIPLRPIPPGHRSGSTATSASPRTSRRTRPVSASFPWIEGADASRETGNPGGYFHLAPGEAFVGGGMWHPEPARLKAFRRLVDATIPRPCTRCSTSLRS